MGKDRFFGLHMDFHANNTDVIGERTNGEELDWFIETMKPDYVQLDCKGHPGNTSYPSEIGKVAENLMTDNFKILCDTVKKHNIPFYIHFTGLWEETYASEHPDEVAVMPFEDNFDYKNPFKLISPFSDYHKNVFIPLIKEVIDKYDVDGVWVDGDAWCVLDDYSDLSKKFIPEGLSLKEHKEYGRKRYMECFKNYVDELHNYKPGFKIINNWAYSTYMPEKIDVDVDYLSADIHGLEPYEHTLIESKMFATHDIKWDMMSWGSLNPPIINGANAILTRRSGAQVNQEAAITVSHGGGFELYVGQNPDGSVAVDRNNMFKELADFMHPRRFLHDKKSVAQVGVFYSVDGQYKDTEKRLYHVSRPGRDVMKCFADSQYTANFVLEHQLDDIAKYDVMVVPEWDNIPDSKKKILTDYASNGGNLLVIGAKACKQFGELVGESFGEVEENANRFVLVDNSFLRIIGDFVDLKKGVGETYERMDMRDTLGAPAYRIDSFGSGKIAYIPFNLGKAYRAYEVCYIRDYLTAVVDSLCEKAVKVSKKNIVLTTLEDGDKILLNLVNSLNAGGYVFDYIPEMHDIDITVKGKFKSVKMPLGESFTYELTEDCAKIHLDKLEIHSVIELR